MELELLVDELLQLLKNTNKTDDYFLNRYSRLANELREMVKEVKSDLYPKNLVVLPMFHYIDRNVDDSQLYEQMNVINEWYILNYREKDEAVIDREMVITYLCSECHMTENRARTTLKKLAKYKEIYWEFVKYIKTREFAKNAINIEGYTAEELYTCYPLSVVGAYNYLIYLIEEPKHALADLRAGLPRK